MKKKENTSNHSSSTTRSSSSMDLINDTISNIEIESNKDNWIEEETLIYNHLDGNKLENSIHSETYSISNGLNTRKQNESISSCPMIEKIPTNIINNKSITSSLICSNGNEYMIQWTGGDLGLALTSLDIIDKNTNNIIPYGVKINRITYKGKPDGIKNAVPGDLLISINNKIMLKKKLNDVIHYLQICTLPATLIFSRPTDLLINNTNSFNNKINNSNNNNNNEYNSNILYNRQSDLNYSSCSSIPTISTIYNNISNNNNSTTNHSIKNISIHNNNSINNNNHWSYTTNSTNFSKKSFDMTSMNHSLPEVNSNYNNNIKNNQINNVNNNHNNNQNTNQNNYQNNYHNNDINNSQNYDRNNHDSNNLDNNYSNHINNNQPSIQDIINQKRCSELSHHPNQQIDKNNNKSKNDENDDNNHYVVLTPFHLSCIKGDIHSFCSLMKESLKSNHFTNQMFLQEDNHGQTCLHLAVRYNHLEIVKSILKNINSNDMIRHLLKTTDKKGNTALHFAVNKRPMFVYLLLAAYNKSITKNQNEENNSFINKMKHSTIVMNQGNIDLTNILNERKLSPLLINIMTTKNDCIKIPQLLIEEGYANPNAEGCPPQDPDNTNISTQLYPKSALHIAIDRNLLKIAGLLIYKGAKINIIDKNSGKYLLEKIYYGNNKNKNQIIKYLLKNIFYTPVYINIKDRQYCMNYGICQKKLIKTLIYNNYHNCAHCGRIFCVDCCNISVDYYKFPEGFPKRITSGGKAVNTKRKVCKICYIIIKEKNDFRNHEGNDNLRADGFYGNHNNKNFISRVIHHEWEEINPNKNRKYEKNVK